MSERKVKALGEIALRVENLDEVQDFYERIVGLELMKRFPRAAFFNIAPGFAGHTQVLALFDRQEEKGYQGLSAGQTTIDHLAFTIALDDFEAEKNRLRQLGVAVRSSEHAWVQWRSLYFHDPAGHLVEFVCFDPSVIK
jgi:catechol 2,3-dioxygenase-like lactoylglutathione lyase family enzyme